MRDFSLTDLVEPVQKLTTQDAARVLRMTDAGVRYLAHHRQLPFERTRSGQFLFRSDDVERIAGERAHGALATIRPQMLKTQSGPRQLFLFGTHALAMAADRFRPRSTTFRSQSESTRERSEKRDRAS